MRWDAYQNGFHVEPGQAVGLLGGSFDPPHAGHVNLTLLRAGPHRLAGEPRQSAQGPRPRAAGRADGGGACPDGSPPRHRERFRGAGRHEVHGAHDRRDEGGLSRDALRLVDGGRQPRAVPPLGRLARHRRTGADRGSGAAGQPACRAGLGRGHGAQAVATSGARRRVARPRGAPGVVLREHADEPAQLHRAARKAGRSEDVIGPACAQPCRTPAERVKSRA